MRKLAFGFVLLAVTLVFGAVSASAEDGVALKQIAPGTVFNYTSKDGPLKITVKSMNGAILMQEETGLKTEMVENIGFSIAMKSTRRETMTDSDRALVQTLSPLKVGTVIKTRHDGETRGYPWSCQDKIEVTGTAKVTVPAGTFDTYVIQTAQRDTQAHWRGDGTCWYSPEVGHCVKVKWRSSRLDYDTELVSVEIPPAAQ